MDLPRLLTKEQAQDLIAKGVLRSSIARDVGVISNWHTDREKARFYLRTAEGTYLWMDIKGIEEQLAYFRELDLLRGYKGD